MIVDWAAYEMGLPRADILGPSREARYFRARAAIAWVVRHALGFSMPRIAAVLGRPNHTTTLNQLRRAAVMRDRDPAFLMLTDKLIERVRQEQGQ
ncbi:helix-turn-helix domain-containing protein [Sphingomonas sp. ERG5]|uniref:helix-turn-helix domain-containing protein n=1 Tax=Sphingomonas sp. ERG5 TaxID=1381597 RepID=UPI000A88D835|nr:helix-turn-helix domain-containing protein [Sphingomonas sp. ERG5]